MNTTKISRISTQESDGPLTDGNHANLRICSKLEKMANGLRQSKFMLALAAGLVLTLTAKAQVVLTDIGPTAPTPGPNDISQLTAATAAQKPDNLNYYFDNSSPPGQTFTTGANPQGYVLTTLSILTAGGGGSLPAGGQAYVLYLYTVSGSTATLLTSFTSANNFTFVETDWLQWTGMGVTLQPNTQYAYTLHRVTTGWENLSSVTPNPYAGGEVCLIPTAGGTIAFGSSHSFDATFVVGLGLPAAPIPNPPGETPAYGSGGIVAGASVKLTASAAGSTPMYYYWQTDGGSGGALTNIPGATGSNFVVNTIGFALGTYQYSFLASNSLGTAQSSPLGIVIAPVAMMDIGSNAPVTGPDDISQLLNTNQQDDGVNYYTDNGAGHNIWSGQTFTTGTNPNGYLLQTMAWKSAGNGSSFGNWQPYNIYFYSISADGTTGTLIANYQGYGGGIENDWFQWQGLSVPLAPNTVYGYTFGRANDGPTSSTGWEHMGTQGGNPYSGGQIMNVGGGNPTNGPVTYGPSGNSDATFSLGIVVSQKPNAAVPLYTPNLSSFYAGTPVTLQEIAVGTPPLTYQWLTDNGTGGTLTPVGGATSTNLALNTSGFTAGNYKYAIIVNNSFGSSTSAPVTLSFVGASAPITVTDVTPAPANQGYVGQTLTFSAKFTGTLPITYQWYVDKGTGSVPINPASNSSAVSNVLVLSNLQPSDVGTYSVTAHNSVGNTSSSTSALTVLTPPGSPAAGTLGAMVLSQNPVAYWRLNEMSDTSAGILPAYDASGHNFDGVYGQYTYNGLSGYLGPQPPAFPGFEADNTALFCSIGNTNSWVTVPPLNFNTNAVTISMWINPVGAVAANSGLFVSRNSANTDAAGLTFGNVVNAAGVAELGYVWNSNSAATYGFNSGLYPPLNQWSFVALVIKTNQATMYLYYIDPNTSQPVLNSAINSIVHSNETFNVASTIGTDPNAYVARVFNGSIDDVAIFNSAMTSDQILAQFSKGAGLSGSIAASIGGQPQSVTTYAGHTVTLAATGINGTSPFSYQWQSNSVNMTDGGNISGSQTPTLTIASATTPNSGTYKLVVTNPVGPTSSSNAVVNIVTPVPNSYESVVAGLNPFAFWKFNETSDPSVGGVSAFDYVGGHTGTYQIAAQNGFNGIVGPEAPAFPGFPANYSALGTVANTANSYVTASGGNLIGTNLTYAMWIKPSGPVATFTGLLMDRGGAGEGLGFGGTVDGTGMSELGYTWNNNGTWSYNSSLYPPANQWSFVAMVIEPTKATLYLMNSSGIQSATNAIAHDSEAFASAWHIGDDATGTAGARTFPGSISDVSVYLSALSPSQVTSLYNAGLGNVAPPNVMIQIAPNGLGSDTLIWPQGVLLQASSPNGPWTTNAAATSPYTVGTTNSSMFFRVQVQ